jgi:hypothetical protein
MNRMAVLFLVALSSCAGKQPLRVDCERRLVPINEPEQIDSSRREPQPKEEGRQQ